MLKFIDVRPDISFLATFIIVYFGHNMMVMICKNMQSIEYKCPPWTGLSRFCSSLRHCLVRCRSSDIKRSTIRRENVKLDI